MWPGLRKESALWMGNERLDGLDHLRPGLGAVIHRLGAVIHGKSWIVS